MKYLIDFLENKNIEQTLVVLNVDDYFFTPTNMRKREIFGYYFWE